MFSVWNPPTRAQAQREAAAVSEGFCPDGHGKLSPDGLCVPCYGVWTATADEVNWRRTIWPDGWPPTLG